MLSNDYHNKKSQLIRMVWTTPRINPVEEEDHQIEDQEDQKKTPRKSHEILRFLQDTVSPYAPEQHYPSLEAIAEKNSDSSFFRAKKWVKGSVELLRQEYEKTSNPVAVWKAIHLLHTLDGDDWMQRAQYHRWIVEYLQSVAQNMAKTIHIWRSGTAVEKELPILLKFSSGIPKDRNRYVQKMKLHERNHLIVELMGIVKKLIKAKLVTLKKGDSPSSLVSNILEANGIFGRGGNPLSTGLIEDIVHDYKKPHHHPAE